ncbi:hypothetical protein SAMN05518871_109140 [Psychrobacillus sp. OK028]|uniref:hypothetical protein n=1 Tax=Psychrobacillus sp. OK028 TaxID=1884359 RepID=UPI000889F48F|nr:hypothetical protein [Psychrobacillus sp. OK028]SDO02673.1 hypothetical protein SAMN05518871_109140 [Psychrobacillus sp. OK028]
MDINNEKDMFTGKYEHLFEWEKEYLGVVIGVGADFIKKHLLLKYGVEQEHFIQTVKLPHIGLLDLLIQTEGVENFDRVIVYSKNDFKHKEEFLHLYRVCSEWELNFTTIRENIQSEDFKNEKEFIRFLGL